jgi:hypothetical protein
MVPSVPTRTIAGAELVHCTRSARRSPALENTSALSRTRCPTSSRDGRGATSIRAGAPGTMAISKRWITGFTPGVIPTTVTGIVPTEPERTRPVESTAPSNMPPECAKVMRALGIGCPDASTS